MNPPWQPDYLSFRLRLAALRPYLSVSLPFSKVNIHPTINYTGFENKVL